MKPTVEKLDKIIELVRNESGRGGWSKWVSPKMKGYKMECCDCGLIHEIEFDIVKFTGKTKGELSHSICIDDKDMQVIFRMRRKQ